MHDLAGAGPVQLTTGKAGTVERLSQQREAAARQLSASTREAIRARTSLAAKITLIEGEEHDATRARNLLLPNARDHEAALGKSSVDLPSSQ